MLKAAVLCNDIFKNSTTTNMAAKSINIVAVKNKKLLSKICSKGQKSIACFFADGYTVFIDTLKIGKY